MVFKAGRCHQHSQLGKGLAILMGALCVMAGSVQAADYAYAPVAGSLTSPFGWRSDPFTGGSRFHGGIDIAAPEGTPVYTPDSGTVVYSGSYGGYGNVVVVQHPNNLYTVYGHNSYLMVHYKDTVKAGQMISLVGSTGRSTGPHLHFEVRQGNSYVNPLDYLNYLSQIGHYPLAQAPVQTASAATTRVAANTSSTGTISAHKVRPRTRRKPNWSVEVIKGDNVEMVEF